MGGYTRRQLPSTTAGIAGLTAFSGCLSVRADSTGNSSGSEEMGRPVARASFFIFGDFASHVAGDTASTDVLVPIGQHGHGWEPGPRVREKIHDADVFVHGGPGFQPWADDILHDISHDGGDVVTVDLSAGLSLLDADAGHTHHDEHGEETHSDHHEGGDPHFWMDPVRAKESVANIRHGLTEVDGEHAEIYEKNASAYQATLTALHDRTKSLVEKASKDVLLVAGHDAFTYFSNRYDIQVETLTGSSPDDQLTTRDIERAQHIIEDHNLDYICADPLEPQQAAEQLVAETTASAVLPLTAMPGLKQDWVHQRWGYRQIMEEVNLPTLEHALDA